MTNGIDELLDGLGKVAKTFPEIYKDGLQPTVQETSKVLARIPRAINAAFSSFDNWIDNKIYNVEATKKLLEKKLENVDANSIVAPEAYVAIPALQAISYSMDSEDLRNLYSNLLAKSMQISTKDSVHPSFVEIIKQLSPMDANVLKLLSQNIEDITEFYPVIRIYRSTSYSGRIYKQHIPETKLGISRDNFNSFELSLDNLIRLNLISLEYNQEVAEEYLYDEIRNSQLYKELVHEIESSEGVSEYCQYFDEPGLFYFSPLGLSFIKVCLD